MRKKGQGRGVGIYVNKRLNARILEKDFFFIDNVLENIAVIIEILSRRKIIASLCRPNCHKTLLATEQFNDFFSVFA